MKINYFTGLSFSKLAVIASVLFGVSTTIFLFPFSARQITKAATAAPEAPELAIGITQQSASLTIYSTEANGNFGASEENEKLKFWAYTNNYSGYTLSISADEGDGGIYSGNNLLQSIPRALSLSEFDSASYNNMWGILPNMYNSEDNNYFLPSPATEPMVINETYGSDGEPLAYSIGFGARIGSNTPAGSYQKTINLSITANPIGFSIYFKKNTNDYVWNIAYGQFNTTTDTIAIIDENVVPQRDGYDFVGWCRNSGEVCFGEIYQPGGAIYIDPTTENEIYLYALWEENGPQEPDEIIVTFNGAGASEYEHLNDISLLEGDCIYLPDNVYYYDNHYFQGWGENQSSVVDYHIEDDFCPTANTDFYAVWGESKDTRLYNAVASLSKGTFSDYGISLADPLYSGSHGYGVFFYDEDEFAPANDASDEYGIYFYRGNVDYQAGEQGSDGDSNNYPSYVRLDNDTCWRVVRTTGSGGTKIIYNGRYDYDNNTCARISSDTVIGLSPFNDTLYSTGNKTYYGIDGQNAHSIGYTYSNIPASTYDVMTVADVYGRSGNDTTTNINSSILKSYTEDWFEENMFGYIDMLEGNAGYCNDRTVNEGALWETPLLDNATFTSTGYTENNYYFGVQNHFSLNCPRGDVDLYSTDASLGGNGQLKYPIAHLTSSELEFARGLDNYLTNGTDFWLMSPSYRFFQQNMYAYLLESSTNYPSAEYVGLVYSVRPVVSLKHDTLISSGSGTATNPWIIELETTTSDAMQE